MRAQYEPIPTLENSSFNAFIQVKKEFDFPFHYHPEYELTYILSSSGIRYVGNSFETFSENDLVLLGPDLPHCWKNTADHWTEAAAIVIQWNGDLLGSDWLQRKEFTAIQQLHQLSYRGIKFPEKIALQFRAQMVQLVEEKSAFERMMKFINILNHLSAADERNILCEEDFSNTRKFKDSERISMIGQYLAAHYKEKITLGDMASLVCMTEESFSRFFSKLMKKPFFSFLNEYRLNIACKLLVETDIPIAQACYQSGYESVSFFYRQFKRFKNCSPQFYRNQFKTTEGIIRL